MHIAIDGKRYFLNSSGLGRYSRNLVNSLLSLEHKEEFFITLFRPKGRVKFDAPSYPQLKLITAKYFLPGDIGNGFWRFVKLPELINAKRYSLFHGPSHVLPGRVKCPTIVTMLDLIFLRFPRYFPMWDRNYYKIMFKKSAHRADHIISISKVTKADLINFFGVDEDKVSVVYPALDDLFTPLVEHQLEEVKEKFGLPEYYILYVGNIEPRKNILRLAQAFDYLVSSGRISEEVQLLIVGQKGWFYKDIFAGINALPNREKITFMGPVFGQNLAGIYQMARVMAYPSMFEGFGYPVLEAMRLGAPVLTSRVSSLPEAGGDAAFLIEPESIDDIASGLEKLINDESLREDLIQRGYKHAQRFTAEKMARQTMAIYKRFVR